MRERFHWLFGSRRSPVTWAIVIVVPGFLIYLVASAFASGSPLAPAMLVMGIVWFAGHGLLLHLERRPEEEQRLRR